MINLLPSSMSTCLSLEEDTLVLDDNLTECMDE